MMVSRTLTFNALETKQNDFSFKLIIKTHFLKFSYFNSIISLIFVSLLLFYIISTLKDYLTLYSS